MLAESMVLGNIDGYINRSRDQPYLEGKHLSCACVVVPSTIFQEDAIEPKTGIKFPAFLEGDPSPATTVLVGMGFKGMKIMKVKKLNLYACGLYMQPNSICEKLDPKYASVPTTALKDHPDFYNDLMRENLHMRVRLVVNYNGLSIGAVRDVFEKSLGLRLQKMNPNTDYRCLKTFYAHTGCSTVAWWVLMTLLDPANSFANLIYVGYSGVFNSAFTITRKRRVDRKKQQTQRNMFLCYVFGPKGNLLMLCQLIASGLQQILFNCLIMK